MKLRSPGWLVILFAFGTFALILAEISALIWVSKEIGWWTLLLLLASAALGLGLMKWQWSKAWGALTESARSGHLPPGKLADASLILIGGILLVVPGLISDIIGLLMLIPFTRQFVRSAVSWWAARTLQRSGSGNGDVIAGEVVPEQGTATGDTLIPGVIEGSIVEDDRPQN